MKQLRLFKLENRKKPFQSIKGRRKSRRPISSRNPTHLILKSKKGDLKPQESEIISIWNQCTKKFKIKNYSIVVNINHIHAALRFCGGSVQYRRFIRAVTGVLGRRLKIAWALSPLTRIVTWGRDYFGLLKYLKLNDLEANNIIPYRVGRTRGWQPP